MKKLVVFKSVLGTTKEYSEWISKQIGADIFQWYQVNRRDMAKYDLVVVASGPYEHWQPLADYLEKNWDILKDKVVVVVGVGEIPSDTGIKWDPKEKIKSDIWEEITYYWLPGRLNPETEDQVGEDKVEPIVEHIKKVSGVNGDSGSGNRKAADSK